jgi:large subunit ribosomal protein L18
MIKSSKINRHKRVRTKVFGTVDRPRLVVSRSNKHIVAQIIDDESGKTLISGNTYKMKNTQKMKMATELGKDIADKANSKKIKEIVFDKGGSKYHGRVKALADTVRDGGIKF